MSALTDLRGYLRSFTDRSSAILTDSLCDELLRAAQERLQEAHRWSGQETSTDITYAATDDGKALPADFIEELAVSLVNAGATPSNALTPVSKLAGGREAWLSSQPAPVRDTLYPQTADPRALTRVAYYLWMGKLYYVPNPTAQITLRLDYYGRIAPLSVGTPDNWFSGRYLNALRFGGLVETYLFLHDRDSAASWEAVFQEAVKRAVVDDTQRRFSGGPRSRGT